MSQSNISLPRKVLLGVGVSLAVGGASYYLYKRYVREIIPTEWRRVGQVEGINIFPVKSMGPLPITEDDEFWTDILGLRLGAVLDRQLMLLDAENKIVTARAYPKMVLIQPKLIAPKLLRFSATGMPDLDLDIVKVVNDLPKGYVHTCIFGADVDVKLCGREFNTWFSRCILGKDTGLKLVYYPHAGPTRPTVTSMRHEPDLSPSDSGAFGDATSYMMMNLSSVDDLNTRLKDPLDAVQFRGTFHLKMDVSEPYAEDNWKWVRIGDDAVFRIVAPCTRCIVPNINPVTGDRDPNGEPLKTLRTYRLQNRPAPSLGSHMAIRMPGSIKLHDPIYVEDSTVKDV